MSEKINYPFWAGKEGGTHARNTSAEHEVEREQARLAAEAANRQRLRFDRLIVGGRAHAKKQGLS